MNTPLVMKAWPSMVSEAMPSGEEMVKVPPWVVLSFEVSEPADSQRRGWPGGHPH
ncbi:hypothetical protein [Mesorhizobium sp. C268A]|uniref:hypothetical protein n=1 Tax=Mesorhizobium sp. C268A TaxID=2956826 RepID=UPI003339A9DC